MMPIKKIAREFAKSPQTGWVIQRAPNVLPNLYALLKLSGRVYKTRPAWGDFRRFCMDCRNLEAKDGFHCLPPCSLDTGNPCRYDAAQARRKTFANQEG